jgi:hypothetical protein|tara:strand:- start:6161 stop:6706 length:546 start_codon:yes stop_codon:yes gene_type:complete
MSFLHKPATGGYSTAAGKFNEGTMLIGETVEERLEAYEWLTNLSLVVIDLMSKNRLQGWNTHDDDVIPGIALNIGPIHRGGRFKDIVQKQYEKLLRALIKVDSAMEAETGSGMDLPGYFMPKNMAEMEPMLGSQLVKRLNDIRRGGTDEQEELKQNPDLITDTHSNFRDVWGWYLKKKKKK